MAEHPERWTEKTPEQRHLFGRPPTFGLARDAERLPQEMPPATTTTPRKRRRERGPFVTYLQLPWSYGDRDTGDRWHRVWCRWGRHQMCGGHTMRLASTVVFIERRCRWCGAEARDVS